MILPLLAVLPRRNDKHHHSVVSPQRNDKKQIVRLELPPFGFAVFGKFASAKRQKANRKVGFAAFETQHATYGSPGWNKKRQIANKDMVSGTWVSMGHTIKAIYCPQMQRPPRSVGSGLWEGLRNHASAAVGIRSAPPLEEINARHTALHT